MLLALFLTLISAIFAPPPSSPTAPPPPAPPAAAAPVQQAAKPVQKRLEWSVDGVKREAIVVIPPTPAPAAATTAPTPVIFGFHGHGGNARYSVRTFAYQTHWPEAICVYMQGLPTPGMTDPKGLKNGWQKTVGDQEDRDLKFFDAVLATLRKDYKIDEQRIYAAGHSNGGAFTYLLWAARGEIFAAVAPAAAGMRTYRDLKPKPAMHIAGEQDTLVPFAFQKRAMAEVRKINGCEAEGKEWAKGCTLYKSKGGTPFVSMICPGDHTFPAEAPELIVKFFKEQVKSAAAPADKALPEKTRTTPARATAPSAPKSR